MSKCPGLHCPGCGGNAARLAGVLGGVAAVAGAAWLIVTFLWLIAAVAAVALLAVIAVGVWMRLHGPDVATVSRGALPPSDARPLPSRPAEAIQGPQTVNFNFFGPLTREQLDEVDAIREAGYRVYDTYRRDQ